ncbi:MAG: helix-turn-helix domain-containing protein [Emergencia sp.]|nr:helix-turn-helix domain-containing protein [Emergencia sp.]
MSSKLWTDASRENLEFLLQEGYQVPKIAKLIGMAPATIYKELRMTLTEEEYADRRFTKYTAERAWQQERASRSGKVALHEKG